MSAEPLQAFVQAIRSSGLLDPAAADQLAAWAASPNADPQEIAREIVQRKWLTVFQVKQFWRGRGADLFLNQYVLLEKLGEGGMGDVYKARHTRMERDVALKLIRKEKMAHPDSIKRFRREIKAAAQLQHENMVVAYDADQHGDTHFFVMEYVEGMNLADWVAKKGPLPVDQAANFVRQAALGLQHAHECAMVHRDIKPANLLVNKKGVVKILDMGLARIDGPTAETAITVEGLVFGTPDYISPEQSRNARETDIRSDIYSLGCTFYFLLTGDVPYPGGTPTEKMIAHNSEPVPNIQRIGIPPEVEAIVSKMMAKDPADRYATPAEVADALIPFLPSGPQFVSSVMVKALPAQTSGILTKTSQGDIPDTESRFRFASLPVGEKKNAGGGSRLFIAVLTLSVLLAGVVVGGVFMMRKAEGEGAGEKFSKVDSQVGIPFTLLPAGKFEMGAYEADADLPKNEGPVREVEITRAFYMANIETPQRVYERVMGVNPSFTRQLRDSADLPVEGVNWKDAEAFCRKLNLRPDKETGRPAGWTFRLPTEAEWEYACRAGTKSRYFFGTELASSQAAFGKLRVPGKCGTMVANAWGLFDMHGNVMEWTADFYAETYDAKSLKDPHGPAAGNEYVVRGGAYDLPMEECRSSRRKGLDPNTKARNLGFRVVLAPE